MKFVYKLFLNGIIAVALILWFTNASFWEAAISAVVFSVIAYFVGDQLILRASNNTMATIVDAGLALVYFWIVANVMDWTLSFGELIVLTLALGLAEMVYHRFLANDLEKATG